jgi:hypothetical protein
MAKGKVRGKIYIPCDVTKVPPPVELSWTNLGFFAMTESTGESRPLGDILKKQQTAKFQMSITFGKELESIVTGIKRFHFFRRIFF